MSWPAQLRSGIPIIPVNCKFGQFFAAQPLPEFWLGQGDRTGKVTKLPIVWEGCTAKSNLSKMVSLAC